MRQGSGHRTCRGGDGSLEPGSHERKQQATAMPRSAPCGQYNNKPRIGDIRARSIPERIRAIVAQRAARQDVPRSNLGTRSTRAPLRRCASAR